MTCELIGEFFLLLLFFPFSSFLPPPGALTQSLCREATQYEEDKPIGQAGGWAKSCGVFPSALRVYEIGWGSCRIFLPLLSKNSKMQMIHVVAMVMS